MSKNTRLVLARHHKTVWNVEGRLQGQTDVELNHAGRVGSRDLALHLLDQAFKIDHIISSGLSRAAETALIIQDVFASSNIYPRASIDERLQECHMGSIEGKTKDEVKGLPGLANILGPGDPLDFDLTPYGGENRQMLLERVTKAIDAIYEAYEEETVLVISHGQALWTWLGENGHDSEKLVQGGFYIVE